MLFNLAVVVLIFAAGGVFGQLLPDLWAGEAVSLIAVAADLATLCAAGAAIYALGAWRQQIRSQKAYDALGLVLSSLRDKDLTYSAMMASSKGGEDRRKADYNLRLIARDVRRCTEELEVLGYVGWKPRLVQAMHDLEREVAPWFKPRESGSVLDVVYGIGPALDRFVETIYGLQREVFRRGLW